ncbi:hypothetical protein [Archangium sp.]|uniref:hypothetical protein n=1 Tax=Archangium sp. TaxID=1872627 RepID=UPI002D2D6A96|nr:hypothetical protein [Archangium sp.]HYO56452.1 hypothetical protein [Archangium sp.]
MKRFIVSLMVVAGALLSACTEQEEILQTVGLVGTYDVALVNYPPGEGADLLFVTSTDNNELRVLSLEEDADERRFVRAPNPIESLAIPVLSRPQGLTRDVRYDGSGVEQTGRLVFARSSGSTEISVVSADRDVLREVRRLETRTLTASAETPSTGPVTAFAARAPEGDDRSTLYFATQEGAGARLWQVLLPAREILNAERGRAEAERTLVRAEPLGVALPPNVAVSSILVLPQSGMLAVATRGAAGTVGKTYRVNLATNETRELNFGGAQVLQLATHGRVPGAEGQPPLLTEGQRIFGILDASSCGGQSQCTGVLAVEASTGEVAKDSSGYPMLPVSVGSGLPMGLSLSTNTNLSVQTGEPTDAAGNSRGIAVPLLGVVPLSNGTIVFFDALRLIPLNVGAIWDDEDDEGKATASISLVNAQGAAQDGAADIVFEGTFGVTRDQTFQLTYQGLLPGMALVERDATGGFKVPFEPRPGKGQVVQPGDLIILLSGSTGGQPCTPELTVLAVQPPSPPETRATLVPSGAVSEDCAGYGFFQVRASGPQPLVLSSSSEDYIQRLGSGDTFSRQGPYFFHPPGYQGQSENLAVRIRVVRQNLNDPNQGLTRGNRYVVETESHFYPYLISVDLSIPDLSFFRVPGPVVQARVGNMDYAYIAYPSANGVLQVELTNIIAGAANNRGLFPFL